MGNTGCRPEEDKVEIMVGYTGERLREIQKGETRRKTQLRA